MQLRKQDSCHWLCGSRTSSCCFCVSVLYSTLVEYIGGWMNVWLHVWSCAVHCWLKDFISGWSPVERKKKQPTFVSGEQWIWVGNCSLTLRTVLLTLHRCSASCGSLQFHISNENLKQSLKLGARLWYFCSLWAKPFFPRSLMAWFCIPRNEWPPEWVAIGWALPSCCVAATNPAWHGCALGSVREPSKDGVPISIAAHTLSGEFLADIVYSVMMEKMRHCEIPTDVIL